MTGRPLRQFDPNGTIAGIQEAYHVAFYRAERAGYQDMVSRYISDFVQGKEPQTTRWIKLAVPLITGSGSFDIIVRALLEKEKESTEFTPLDRLCLSVAKESGAVYAPERLEKTRTVSEADETPGREARKQQLDGLYQFDAEGLTGKARVLVVDTLLRTGSTIEAIAGAVHKELPEAEVACLVLGKVDSEEHNTHLNPEYFVSPKNGLSPVPEDGGETADTGRKIPIRHSRGPRKMSDEGAPAQRPRRRGKRSSRFWAYITGSAVLFLTLGALVPLLSGGKPAALPEMPVVTASVWAKDKPAEKATPPRKAPVKKKYWGPPGVVTVSQMGLRQTHSLGAKSVANATVRNGEHVSILKRYKPAAGPRWMKIRTRKGKVGWVFASAVQEKKRR
ncbi:MAG: SH3 domain-containing protein [Bacteroidota bacterium]